MSNREQRRKSAKANRKNRSHHQYARAMETFVRDPIVVTKQRGLVAHFDNGNVTLTDKFGVPYKQSNIDMTMTYQGANKTRTIAKSVGLAEGVNNVAEWIKNFDLIFAADTNTKQYSADCLISAGVLYQASVVSQNEKGGTLNCQPLTAFNWVWKGQCSIENYTWVEAIKQIQKTQPAHKKIALVVDSQLSDLEEYNSRKKPLADSFFLPENFTLLYASADYKDNWANNLIRFCDEAATKQLRRFQGEPILQYLQNASIPKPLVYVAQYQENSQ